MVVLNWSARRGLTNQPISRGAAIAPGSVVESPSWLETDALLAQLGDVAQLNGGNVC